MELSFRFRKRSGLPRNYTGVLARWQSHTGTGPIGQSTGTRTVDPDVESFADIATNPHGVNPCVHVKREYFPIDLGGHQSSDWNRVWVYGSMEHKWVSSPSVPTISQADRDTALGYLLDLFESPPPPYDIGETVAELILLVTSIAKKREVIVRHFTRWSSWIRNFSPAAWKAWISLQAKAIAQQVREAPAVHLLLLKALKKAPKGIANSYLSWHFGIKPFVQAVVEFKGAYQRTLDLLEKFVQSNNQWKRHTRSHRPKMPDLTPIPSVFGYHAGIYHVTLREAKISLGVSVKTAYPEVERALAELKGEQRLSKAGFKAAAYSLGFTPLVAWQLIPFSFVVDWFVRVDSKLKAYTGRLCDGEILLKDECMTEKTKVGFDHYYGHYCPTYTHNGTVYTNSPKLCGFGTVSSFIRSPSLPSRSFAPGELSTGQEMFVLALALQRTR